MSWQGGPPGYRPPHGAPPPYGAPQPPQPQPMSPVPYMGQAPGHAPHPVSPPPYMGPPPVAAAPPPAAAPMMSHPRMVFGFPLEPGERVLYYKRIPSLGARVFYLVFGVPMILLIGIGIYLIYLGITHRKQFAYAHVVTNRRMFALDGHGHEMKGMRWESVVGMNKVSTSTGLVRQIGVRNAQGATCLFDDDMATLERVIAALLQEPGQRETWPEVAFDAHVT